MTVTREQVADLWVGDVVEYSGHPALCGAKLVGPLYIGPTGSLCIADYVVRTPSGDGPTVGRPTLTVISRAPRPLYVNHDRTEPVQGDVVRFEDDRCPEDDYTNVFDPKGDVRRPWLQLSGERWSYGQAWPDERNRHHYRFTLLVDGETGQVVP